jgi:hypothetical protein
LPKVVTSFYLTEKTGVMNKNYFIFSVLAITIFSSCATYKNGQTPDDVYYSPVIGVAAEKIQNNTTARNEYENYVSSDDRYLRMRVANRDRWSAMDDFYYWNDPRFNMYSFNNFNGFNNWNNCFNCNTGWGNNWNSWNNGFGFNNSFVGIGNTWGWNTWGWNNFTPSFWNGGCISAPVVLITKPQSNRFTGGSNVTAFRNSMFNNNNNTYVNPKGSTQNNNSFGNLLRRVVGSSSNNSASSNTTTVDRPSRTFSSGTTTTNSTGGNSGGYRSSGSSASGGRSGRN